MEANKLARIMEVMNFTQEDLDYNRRGEFSPRQKDSDASMSRGCLRYGLLGVLIAIVLLVVGLVSDEDTFNLVLPFAIIAGILGIGSILVSRSSYTSSHQIKSVTGKIRIHIAPGHETASYHYIIETGKESFSIPRTLYELLDEEHDYAIYYFEIGSSRKLMTLEPMS